MISYVLADTERSYHPEDDDSAVMGDQNKTNYVIQGLIYWLSFVLSQYCYHQPHTGVPK